MSADVTFRDPWETTFEDKLTDYLRYLRQFAGIAASTQLDYYFVLQPVPVYKTLSEEEKHVVIHTHYKREYDLVDAMFRKTVGERYLSLKDLFQHDTRQVFYDDAHMNKSGDLAYGGTTISYGQEKMAEKLAEFLAEKGAIAHIACAN
jgi:hypothetical protein